MKKPVTLILIITLPFVFIHIKAQDEKVKTNVDTLNAPPVIYKISTGYSEQFVDDIIFSVPIVKDNEMNLVPDCNLPSRLQGILPGLYAIGNGTPGNVSEIYIRGISSFSGSTPLFIVDGVPVNDLSLLNPDDVEAIALLKDGAASIYGSRAMGGVLVITTKKGRKGLKVGYNVYYGWSQPGKGPAGDLLNAEEYGRLQWQIYRNDNYDEYHPVYGPSTNPEATLPGWAGNTDWYSEMTRKAPVQRHELSVTGGSDHSRFFASFAAHSEDGLLINTYSRKYHLRFNSEWNIFNDKVTVGENFTISFNKFNNPAQGENSPFHIGPYLSQSIIPVYMDEFVDGTMHDFVPGDFGGTGLAPRLGNSPNVVADLVRNKDDYTLNMGFLGNAWVRFYLFEGLSFTSTVGGTYSSGYGIDFTGQTYERAENTTSDVFTEQSGYIQDRVWTNTLRYEQKFGNHRVDVLGGQETVRPGRSRNMYAAASGYFSDALSFRTISNGSVKTSVASWFINGEPLKSWFINASYILKDRYMINLTMRRDKGKNSFFSPDEELRDYTSFAAAWKIGHERFLNNMGWINGLTLRGSFGKTGNKSMNWEYNEILDVGFDWQFFNRHLNIDFDWYMKESSDLLFAIEVVGTQNPMIHYVNTGSMENTGIDFAIGYNKKWNLIGFNANLVLSSYNNRITNLSEGVDFYDSQGTRMGTAARNKPGHSVGEFYGYKVAGLFQENEFHMELDEDYYAIFVLNDGIPSQYGAEPGLLKFENTDASDNNITPGDRTFIGSPHPDFTVGFNSGLTIGKFDMSALLYWSQGNEIFNYTKWCTDFWPSFQGQKSKRLLYESWTTENTGAKVPKATNTSNFSTNTQITSYYIEDGSYIRMKSLQLGYSVNKNILNKAHISTLRIYLQALNLFTITKYSGLDPELGGSFGFDSGNYPNTRQFLVGLQLEI